MKANGQGQGQVLGQTCSHCGRPSTVCAGRCTICDTGCEWDAEEQAYVCKCGESYMKLTPWYGNHEKEEA